MDRLLSTSKTTLRSQLDALAQEWLLKRDRSLRFKNDLAEFAEEAISQLGIAEVPHYQGSEERHGR